MTTDHEELLDCAQIDDDIARTLVSPVSMCDHVKFVEILDAALAGTLAQQGSALILMRAVLKSIDCFGRFWRRCRARLDGTFLGACRRLLLMLPAVGSRGRSQLVETRWKPEVNCTQHQLEFPRSL